jgi:hypothetical protein
VQQEQREPPELPELVALQVQAQPERVQPELPVRRARPRPECRLRRSA